MKFLVLIIVVFNLATLNYAQVPMTVSQYSSMEGNILPFYDMHMALFSTNPTGCLAKLQNGHSIIKTFTADCSDTVFDGDCEVAITEFSASGGGIANHAVFFRHPHNISNFAASVPTRVANMPLVNWGNENQWGRVGQDYLTAFNRILAAGIIDFMYELWGSNCNMIVVSSGHSAGAALAEMFAMYLRKHQLWGRELIHVFSYGAPRVGDPQFSVKLYNSVMSSYRVLYTLDTISQFPATTIDRTQPLSINQTGSTFWSHYGYTIWYSTFRPGPKPLIAGNGRGKYSSCGNPEDPNCDDKGTDISIHYAYFGYTLQSYDAGTC